MMTTLAVMMLTFAAPPSAGAWVPNANLVFADTFYAAPSAWANPPWLPIPYIMAAEAGGGGPAVVPLMMLMGVGN